MYLFWTEGEQKLFFLAGGQNPCYRADAENIICGQVELDMGGLWGFTWKQGVQVGLHDPPVERQLQVASAPERERMKEICNVIFNDT